MTFIADEQWQIETTYSRMFDPPGTHTYSMFELGLNIPIFLVEILGATGIEDEPFAWHRFFLSNFDDVQVVLEATSGIQDHAVNLLLPRYAQDEYEYSISTVLEVYKEESAQHPLRRLYVCANGRRFVYDVAERKDELIKPTLIYRKEKLTAPKPWRNDDEDTSAV